MAGLARGQRNGATEMLGPEAEDQRLEVEDRVIEVSGGKRSLA